MQNEKISKVKKALGSIWAINVYAVFVGSFISWTLLGPEESNLLLVFTTVISATLVNVWYLRYEALSLEKKINQKTKDITSSINFIDKLEKADFKSEIRSLADLVIRINIDTTMHDFFKSQVIRSLDLARNTLSNIHHGVYECSCEEELFLTQELISIPKESIKAVSYQDTDWWLDSQYGEVYLDGVESENNSTNPSFISQRIFIVDKDEEERLQAVFNRHDKLKIEYFIIRPDQVPKSCLFDFVIYDDEILRIATSGSMEMGKRAKITINKVELSHAKSRFQTLIDRVNAE